MTYGNKRAAHERDDSRMFAVLAVVLTIAVMANEIAWIHVDTRLQPVVDEWFEKALNLADGFAGDRIAGWWRHFYWASLGPRFPLYPLLAVPLLWFYDRSVDSLLFVNVASLSVLAYATYQLAARIFDARSGFVAVALVLLYPLTTSIMKLARPHALIPATVALALLALYIVGCSKPAHKRVWCAALAILFVFAAHAGGLPALYGASIFAVVAFLRQLATSEAAPTATEHEVKSSFRNIYSSPMLLRSAIPAATIVLVVIGGWLFIKLDQYRGMLEVAEKFFRPSYSEWHYELTLIYAVGMPGFVLLALGLAFSILTLPWPQRMKQGLAYLLFSLLGTFLVSHYQPGAKSWQNFSGILPMCAAVTAGAAMTILDQTCRRVQATTLGRCGVPLLIALMLTPILFVYCIVNWGHRESTSSLARVLGVRASCAGVQDGLACENPPASGDWFAADVIDVVVRDPRCKASGCDVAVLGHRQAYYSDEALAYSLVQFSPRESRLSSSDFYPERNLRFKRVEGGIDRARRQIGNSQYVIILEPVNLSAANASNGYFSQEGALSNEILQQIQGDSSRGAEVLRRTLPTAEKLIVISLP